MKLYFVRHGESKYNSLKLHQNATVDLSPFGQKQAQKVAKRFEKISIDLILSSPMTRAHETAKEIHKVTKKELKITELLREVKKPTMFEGKSLSDPELESAKDQIKKHFTDPTWHHSDEENFSDLKDRAVKFIKHVATYKKERIAVTTHGDFLRIIVGVMIFGENFTTDIYYSLQKHIALYNTGISICQRDEKALPTGRQGKWMLLTWNDHAHLG